MPVHCQHCSAEIQTNYVNIGMTIACPSCGQLTLLKYAVGSSIPPTGWAVSFRDFEHLLRDNSYRQRIAPMVERWFNCAVESTADGRLSLRKPDQSFLAPEEVHLAIQADAQKQYEIYQAAMDLWR